MNGTSSDARDPSGISRRTGIALALVVGFAIVVRLWGIGFLLPHQTEPDGVVYDLQSRVMREGSRAEETRRLYAFYPHLIARIAAGLPEPDISDATPRTLDEHLARASVHRRNIRLVVALVSVLAVVGAFALARRFLPGPWPLAGAALVAASTFQLWFAQQARPHAPESALALLAVVAAMQLRERGRWRDWIAIALAAGLAIACLQNGLAVLPPIAVAACLRWKSDRGRIVLRLLAVIAIVCAFVFFFYPFLFAGTGAGRVGADPSALHISGHIVDLALFNGQGFPIVLRALWEYDPLVSALGLLGIVMAIVAAVMRRLRSRERLDPRRRDDLLVALAFVVPYFVVIGLYQRTYQRFALMLVPYLALAGAWLCWRFVQAASRRGPLSRKVAISLIGLVIATQAIGAARLALVRSRPDTITEAARFVEAHIGGTTRIAVLPTIDLPLLQTQAARIANKTISLDAAFPWFTYQWNLPPGAFQGATYDLRAMSLESDAKREAARSDPRGFVAALDADYAAIEVFSRGRRPLLIALREAIRASGTLVIRISPDDPDAGEDLPLVYQDDEFPYTLPWTWRAVNARCVGPVIEIYKLR